MESLLPFLQGTCTHYNMPVYPGAQCTIANSYFERGKPGTGGAFEVALKPADTRLVRFGTTASAELSERANDWPAVATSVSHSARKLGPELDDQLCRPISRSKSAGCIGLGSTLK